jgi:hypothetical protein
MPGKYSEAVKLQTNYESRIRKKYESKINNALKELGKLSAFKESFEGIKLENQELPKIESVDNITENKYFLEGRKFGFLLIDNGFTEEMYQGYKQTQKHR